MRKQKKSYDKSLFILALILTGLGILAVADVSAPAAQAYFSDSFYFVKQQLVWGVIGIIGLLIVSRLHYSFWKRIALPAFGVSIVLLILVLIPGFGAKVLGARRWINLGPIGLQPSELVKLTLALYIAKLADQEKPFLSYLIPLLVVSLLIMLQPDLGTNLIVLGIWFTQIFIAGVPIFYLLATLMAGGLAGFILILISGYRRQRFFSFLTSTSDPLGSSYHLRQILIAIGSGGFFGVGLGASRQKYLFLPEASTDSVFAIIAEEVGFLGAGALIVVLAFFIIKCIKIASKAPDKFSTVLAVGISAWLGGQMFLNLGSMLALVPLTGVPLPFFSYGGSSLTMILIGVGILLNISKYAKSRN